MQTADDNDDNAFKTSPNDEGRRDDAGTKRGPWLVTDASDET